MPKGAVSVMETSPSVLSFILIAFPFLASHSNSLLVLKRKIITVAKCLNYYVGKTASCQATQMFSSEIFLTSPHEVWIEAEEDNDDGNGETDTYNSIIA